MVKLNYFILIYLLSSFLSSCEMISAGHGGFTTYSFDTNKETLETSIMKVIKNDSNIYREPEASQEYKDIYKEITAERNKKLKDGYINTDYADYYNDGKYYITIKIRNRDYKFTFRFIGDDEYWETSSNSQFYLVYLYNEYSKGGGYKDKLDPKVIKQLTDVFELEFVNKVSEEMNMPFTKTE
jgi:hypothetical protein